jgi:hypothetical protein
MRSVADADDVQLQESLVAGLMAEAPRGCKLIFLNCEFADCGEGLVSDLYAFAVMKHLFGDVRREQMRLSHELRRLLRTVGKAFMHRTRTTELTMDIVIRGNGQFRYHVDYNPPARIGGALLASKRHHPYGNEHPLLEALVAREQAEEGRTGAVK